MLRLPPLLLRPTAFFLRAMRPRVFRQATGFRTVIARTVGNVAPTPFRGQFPLLPGEKTLALRALVDRSIAEFVLAHGRSAFTARSYPTANQTAVSVAADTAVALSGVGAYEMGCGWVAEQQ